MSQNTWTRLHRCNEQMSTNKSSPLTVSSVSHSTQWYARGNLVDDDTTYTTPCPLTTMPCFCYINWSYLSRRQTECCVSSVFFPVLLASLV